MYGFWFLLGHDEPWSSKDDDDGNSEWAGLKRVLDAAVTARDRGVMTLAAKTGDIDGHVQVGWWRCIKGQSSDPIRAGADWQIVPERRYEYELNSMVE